MRWTGNRSDVPSTWTVGMGGASTTKPLMDRLDIDLVVWCIRALPYLWTARITRGTVSSTVSLMLRVGFRILSIQKSVCGLLCGTCLALLLVLYLFESNLPMQTFSRFGFGTRTRCQFVSVFLRVSQRPGSRRLFPSVFRVRIDNHCFFQLLVANIP